MKKLIGISLLIIVIAIAWNFYLDYQTKTFTEKLPKVPITAEPATGSSTSTDSDETQEVVQTSPDTLAETEIVEEAATADESHLNNHLETQQPQPHEDDDWRTDDASYTTPRKSDPWTQTNSQTQTGGSTHFSKMSPDERADHLRDSWIRMFGDIPEVHAASDYLRKVMKNERLTVDEVIVGLEASHHLFPKSGFNMQLEHYKSMKEMGIPILYPDDIEDNIE